MKINIDAMNRVLQEIVNGRMVRNHSIMLDTITQVDSMLPSEDDYPLNHTTLIFREIESKYIYRIVGMTSQEEECGDLIRYTFLKSDLQEFEFQFRKAKKASEESIITCIFILTSNRKLSYDVSIEPFNEAPYKMYFDELTELAKRVPYIHVSEV